MEPWRHADAGGAVEAASEFYLVLAPDLSIVGASDGYLNATMARREQVLGRHLFEVFPERAGAAVSSGSTDLAASLVRAWRLKRPDAMALRKYDLPWLGGAREERYLSVLHTPVFDPTGAVQWIIQRIEDVTDITPVPSQVRAREAASLEQRRPLSSRPAGRAIQQSAGELRIRPLPPQRPPSERLGEMSHLAAALAHELRQPLSAISSYLSGGRRCLQRGDADNAAVAIDKADEQLRRAGQILRSLGDFIRRGETDQRVQPLAEVIREAARLTLADAPTEAIGLETRFDPDAASAMIDRVQIQQVVANLVRNAVEAMEENAQRSLSIVTRRLEHDMIQISVTDNGPGVGPDIRERLFQPFVTSKAAGMGVGLSLCRAIVEAHGGVLWVEDAPGGRRRLPLHRANAEANGLKRPFTQWC